MIRRTLLINGARGIGNYGGFETFVMHVAPRLVQRGILTFCTCEIDDSQRKDEFEGAKIKYFPIRPPSKYSIRKIFEVVYDNFFNISGSFYSRNILLLSTIGAPTILLSRLMGRNVYVNIDGMEWKRDKFNWLEKAILRVTFKISLIFSNSIIVDSQSLVEEIPEEYRNKTSFIPYGVNDPFSSDNRGAASTDLTEFGIPAGDYWLVIARLEPENNIESIIRAFINNPGRKRLIVVGGFTDKEYEKRMKDIASTSVQFLGHIYDQEVLSLIRNNCYAYIHGHSVGGTNPSLLEAMAAGRLIIAHSNKFNREVLGDTGLFFEDSEELIRQIERVDLGNPEIARLAAESRIRVLKWYSWDVVADQYCRLIEREEY